MNSVATAAEVVEREENNNNKKKTGYDFEFIFNSFAAKKSTEIIHKSSLA